MRMALMALVGLVAGPALASPARMPQGQAETQAAIGGRGVTEVSSTSGLRRWIDGFRARALQAGIGADVFDSALNGLRYNAAVVERDRNQAEFTKPIWDYLDNAVSEERIRNGRAALARHAALLDRIEASFGVDREVVVAIWGLESAYGTVRGDVPVIEALATLAYDGRRGRFFEDQLIEALRIVQQGDVSAQGMLGSWAGAMGHTQFIPSSYHAFAVDFDGDGRRDIWGDDPGDALASTAAYLARSGWVRGRPWGVEVVLPEGFDYGQTGERVRRPVADWAALGVRAAPGGALPEGGEASVLLPAGARGVALLILGNFRVIERYNSADAYVIAVGHLADRLRGGPGFRAGWPRGDRALRLDERVELQERLARAGHDPGAVDGRIGPNTIAAVRAFQRQAGMIPDGYPSLDLLQRLR